MTILTKKKSGRMRKAIYFCLLALLFVVAVPLIPYAINAQAEDVPTSKADKVVALPNPAINLWNNVRQRQGKVDSSTQARGIDTDILISETGEQWRQYRMNSLIPVSAAVLAATFLLIVLFRLWRGKILIQAGRSGKKILRFTLNQRTAHWLSAIMFVLLGLTGMVLLYGRFVLIPLLGAEGFSATAVVAKNIHDYIGPAFAVVLIIQFFLFVKGNAIKWKEDVAWFRNAGGLMGKHASAQCYNAGEKAWFWLVMIGGVVVIVSGFILDFPIFEQGRQTMALFHVIHTIAAASILAASFGHIYMGTIAMEGTFEVMATGYCDENWAKEHHDLWYKNKLAEQQAGRSAAEKAEGITQTPTHSG